MSLKPTQFAVGMLEVDEKLKTHRKLSKKQLRVLVDENPIPVVRGPEKNLYVVDGHHFLCVCYCLGLKKVRVQIIKDVYKKNFSYGDFWKWMYKTRNSYPYCQFGEGPRDAIYLPNDIRGVADDPYRSIAWFVRKAGGFKNTDKNFAEFEWANFFRSKGLLAQKGKAGLPEALVEAVKLAQSEEARHLPGFGKLNLQEKEKVKKEVKAKGKKALASQKLATESL